MFTIRESQIAHYDKYLVNKFAERLLKDYSPLHPQMRNVSKQEMARTVEECRKYDIRKASDIRDFVILKYVKRIFDSELLRTEYLRLLETSSLSGSQKMEILNKQINTEKHGR